MRSMRVACWMFLVGAGGLLAGVPADSPKVLVELNLGESPREVTDYAGEIDNIFSDGRVLIAGQPDQEALRGLASQGVTVVVNLRTPGETEDREVVPFDEAALVVELGLDSVPIPIGGEDYPFRESVVDQFAEVLEDHPGTVLLHCRSGVRASYLWIAYLVKVQGMSLDEALARGEAMRIHPSPLEGLLGRDLHLVFVDGP